MQNMHTKTIKTLGLACIIISSILLALSIAGIIASMVGAAAVGSYADNYMYYQGSGGHHGYYYYDYYDYDDLYDLYGYSSNAAGVQLALVMTILLCVFAAACCAVSLIASIIVFRNAYKLEKYGLVFGWSIAGAIVGVFGSGMILTALFIIIAVFTNMDRKLFMSGQYQNAAGINPNAVPGTPTMPVVPASPAIASAPTAAATASSAATAASSNASAVTGVAAPTAPAVPSNPSASSASTASGAQIDQQAQNAQSAASQAPASTQAAAQSGAPLSAESADTVGVVDGIIADGGTDVASNGEAVDASVKIDLEPKDYVVEVTPSDNPGNPEVAIIDSESDVAITTEASEASGDAGAASDDKPNS